MTDPIVSPPPAADPARYVVFSRDIARLQQRHALLMVGGPLALSLLGAWYLPRPVDPWVAVVSFALMATLVAGLGITVGFHRHFAHRAFRASRGLRIAMVIAGQMAGQGPVLYWTALHRRHHAFSDRPGDPHSPAVQAQSRPCSAWRAFWHGHVGWSLAHPVPMPTRYVAELLADPDVKRLNGWYYHCVAAGLALPALLGALWTRSAAGAVWGFYFGGVLRMAITTQGIWSINSVCHRFGSRPHATGEGSTNHLLVALCTYGEGWHNNHHHEPTSARFGRGWGQPDAGWVIIAALRRLGLVWGVLDGRASAQDRDPAPGGGGPTP